MCTAVSTHKGTAAAETLLAVNNIRRQVPPAFYLNAYAFPECAVITQEDPHTLDAFRWGLIPAFCKGKEEAEKIRTMTVNAKAESVFEKPSFRTSILQQRCVVPVSGFYEYKHVGKGKFTHYIFPRQDALFLFAGIYSRWTFHGVEYPTFSILTTPANPMMAAIHNSKLRMPLILDAEQAKAWLHPALTTQEISELLMPYAEEKMEAYTVRKLSPASTDRPDTIQPFNYPELTNTLF